MITSSSRIIISDHALERFVERTDGEIDHLDIAQQQRMLHAELRRGIRFGAQARGDELWLLPSDLVAAVRPDVEGAMVVITVLTKAQALANMESRGVTLRDCSARAIFEQARLEDIAVKRRAFLAKQEKVGQKWEATSER